MFLPLPLVSSSQNLIFRFLQSKQRICIWLYENTALRIEGRIIVRSKPLPTTHLLALTLTPSDLCAQGFDEYMNLVLDEAEEVLIKKKSRKPLGQFASHPLCPNLHRHRFTDARVLHLSGRIMLKGDSITLMQPVKTA